MRFEEIKRNLSMEELLDWYGARVATRSGWRTWRSVRCPFHDDDRPSAAYNETGFICFACGIKGDVIDVVANVEGLTRKEAARFIEENVLG